MPHRRDAIVLRRTALAAALVAVGIAVPPARGEERAPADAAQRLLRAVEHLVPIDDPARCLARSAGDRAPTTRTVHRWVDDAGVVHYSDRAPDTAHWSTVDGLAAAPAVIVEARAAGHTSLPPDFRARAIADAHAIAKILHAQLGVAADAPLKLDLVFAADAAQFAAATGLPETATRAGIYRPRDRAIFVRVQRSQALTLRVLRHEIVHALVHEHVGFLPSALNEGLAEYFEWLRAGGLGGTVATAEYAAHLASFRIAGSEERALRTLLDADVGRFYGSGEAARYAGGLALVSTLMSTGAGQRALSRVLAAQRAQACDPVDAAALLHDAYPGGLAALARDWAASLRSPSRVTHSY